MGECHVHAGIRPADIERWQEEAPDAELLVHPECGCASQAMAFANERTHILSTEQMVNFAKRSPKSRFLIATETGIIHRLEREVPGKRFEPVREDAVCRYMKLTTLEKVRDSLREGKHRVVVDPRRPRRRGSPSSGWSRSAADDRARDEARPGGGAGLRSSISITIDLLPGSRERVPGGTEVLQSFAVGLAAPGVAGEEVERVPRIGHLAAAVGPSDAADQ